MANNQLQVGPQAAGDGSLPTARGGRSGETIAQDAHGRYYETTFRKAVYNGAITGQTTTVGLATTYTGLVLSNPVGSQVNLVVNKCGYSFLVVFGAAASLGLMTGFNSSTNVTHTTPVTPRNQFFTSAGGGVGLLDSSATLPTAPTLNTIFGAGLTGAITTAPTQGPSLVDMEGSLIVPPGGYVAFYTSTASGTNAGVFSFQWEEVSING